MTDRKNRGVSNLPVAIQDVPDAPTVSATDVGTSRAYNNGAATVTFSAATTGGRVSSYSITTTPTTTTTSATASPVTITGLSSATSYTATVTPSSVSGAGNSATTSSFTATTVPQAPTIGTASVTNATTVSLPFTAGATGGSSITSYTTTSSPSISLTTTGTTSPLTVTGSFEVNTAYTFTLTATNANGTSTSSSASNSITPSTSAFESIATTVVGSGGTSTINFNSIPGGYKHLQIRGIARHSLATTGLNLALMTFNSDTGTNYTRHRVQGNGSSSSSTGSINETSITVTLQPHNSETGNTFGSFIIDILDYSNTNKFKTVRSFDGVDTNLSTGSAVAIRSGLWRSTSAVTSISIAQNGNNFTEFSHFALYGIKGVA